MTDITSALVTITFDGLFLFQRENETAPYQARICTDAVGHQLQFKLNKEVHPETGGGFYQISDLLDQQNGLNQISLQVEDATGVLQTAIRDDGTFGHVLKATTLYPGAKIKESAYQSAFFISQGEIGTGDLNDKCFQVQPDFFKDVPFEISDENWKNTVTERKARHGDGIIKENVKPFAQNVRVRIFLEQGQSLRLVNAHNQDLIPRVDFVPNRNFDLVISYLDATRPGSLNDCFGIGHHSDAVKPDGEVTWAFFRPRLPQESAGACCEVVKFP